MEKNKYYTPKISELVVGLEVEFDYPEKPFRLNYTIRRASMLYSDENGKSNIYDIANGNPLVKRLDEEDIISLDFKKQMCGNYTYGNGNIIWLYIIKDKVQIIKFKGEDCVVLFYGYIKNKLELKKILKQTSVL